MKKKLIHSFVFVLIFSMLAGFLPVMSVAASNELVLTKLGHTSANSITISDASTRSVTLTVPYLFSGNSLNLSTGLIVESASNIDKVITEFKSGSAVVIGDATGIVMSVTYYKTGDSTQYTTDYTIKVNRASQVNPTFTGSITKTVSGTMPNSTTNDITFTASDFTSLYNAHDGGAISGISVGGSNLSCGTLNYSGATYTSGTFIAMSNVSLLTFDALATGSVTYVVRAYAGSDHTTTIGSVMLTISVNSSSVPTITGSISKSVSIGGNVTFSGSDFSNCYNLQGGTLSSIVITPTSSWYGTWYKGSTAFTAATSFTPSEIGFLSFSGATAGTATFTWTVSNDKGTSSAGTGTISVGGSSTGAVTYTTAQNTPKTFSALDFYSACYSSTGNLLNFIYFPSLPSTAYGTLYYNYISSSNPGAAINTNSAYYYNSTPSISNVTFAPASGYSGTFTLPYIGYNTNGVTYNGSIQITVGSGSSSGTVSYTTAQNTPRTFSAADFYNACYNSSSSILNFIYFTSLPSASYGTLYNGYTSASNPGSAVNTNAAYYYSGTPSISNITFVPASGYTGTFTLTYMCYTTNNTTVTGTMSITVGSGGSSTEVTYSTAQNTPKVFAASDFYTAYYNSTGSVLSYVYFTSLPSSVYGTLYYNYVSASSPGAALNSSTAFSVSGTPSLSNITFVPASGYTGTFTISYIGYNTNNGTYNGTIRITVGSSGTNSTEVNYTTALNTSKTFLATDFYSAYYNSTGSVLSYVYFPTLPSSTYGTLYYNYISSSSPGTAVSTNTAFSITGTPSISSITFVPATGYTGTFTLSYIGYNTSNGTYNGTVRITVGSGTGTTGVTYSTAQNTPRTFSASDFYNACLSTSGGILSYIYFPSLPSTLYGTLYYNYASTASPGTAVTSSMAFTYNGTPGISNITFVPASNYTGTVTLSYAGYNTSNVYFTGTLTITVGAGTGTGSITYSTAQSAPKTFAAADFYNACITSTGGYLTSIYFPSLPSSLYGTLYYNYVSSTSPGVAVNSGTAFSYSGTPGISSITFVPVAGFTGTVTIPYIGYTTGSTTYNGTVTITIGGGTGSGDITYSTAQNTAKTFTAADFYSACVTSTGTGLNYISVTPPSSIYGTLYYGYSSTTSPGTAVSMATSFYYSSTPSISYLTFVPAAGYTGTVTIPYSGYNTNNVYFSGTIRITVGTAGSSSDVTYTTGQNTPKTFSSSDFYTACVASTGSVLSYITFPILPSPLYGTLYYNYVSATSPGTAVNANTSYLYMGSQTISNLTFVPAAGYTGTVTIPYSGYNTNNVYFSGNVKITVGSGVSSSDVAYSTAQSTPKTFSVTDFTTASLTSTGSVLSYIMLPQLPSSVYGTLYLNYASAASPGIAVSANTAYLSSGTQSIGNITFVPAAGYTGTVTIPYTGYNANNVSFSGNIKITVGTGTSNGAKVTYTMTKGTSKQLLASDFNTACLNATGQTLNYISIASPASAYGTLYTGYASAASPGTSITATTLFYMNGTPSLSDLTFVPASNYTGTVTISYGGVSTGGTSYAGTLEITVTGSVNDISYSTYKNAALKFTASNFNTVCSSATGGNLNYVSFTLPASTSGTLYSNYSTTTHSGTAVTSGTVYFAGSSPSIDSVTFVPASDYTGTVPITYTAVTADSRTYTGKINITVNQKVGSRYFTDVGSSYDWAATAIDYLYEAGVAKGTSGTLYSPGTNISRGDFILMLYRSMGFTGSTSSNFSDVPKNSYYYDAIAAAKALGIAQGGTDNKFNPGSVLTRQDAMIFIYRALTVTGKTVPTGSSSDIAAFSDKGQIPDYALTAIESLIKAGVITGSNGKLNPKGSVTRAEMAVIVYRVDQKW